MKTTTYLFFDGNCEEALKFYEKVLGAKMQLVMHYEGTPAAAAMPEDQKQQVLHGRITVGNATLLASDCPPGRYSKPQGFNLTVDFDKPEEAERVFKEIGEGGSVMEP